MGCGSVSAIIEPRPGPPSSVTGSTMQQYEGHSLTNGTAHNYQAKFLDGTVASPFPPPATIPDTSFWSLIRQVANSVVLSRGASCDWLLDLGSPRMHLKYAEIEPRVRRLASGLNRLGLRSQAVVIFCTRNVSLVQLLYFAVWRLNGVVWILDGGTTSEDLISLIETTSARFLVCDKHTEDAGLAAMKKKQLIFLSVGRLRRSSSIDLVDLLEDDGRDCPEELSVSPDDVILILNNGARHTHRSLIAGWLQGRQLRHTANTPKYFLFPVVTVESTHWTVVMWPLAALLIGKTMLITDMPSTQSVTLVIREFSVPAIVGCPAFIQKVSRHIAEQGGSLPSVLTLVIQSTSSSSFSEKILRKGFPNLRSIDVVYGIEETLFVSSTISPDTEVGELGTFAVSGPLIHPHIVGHLHAYSMGKVVDLDTGVRLGPGEPGQLCLRSESAFSGYSERPGAKVKASYDGWIHTGDFGYYDGSGTFYVTGPVAEVFKHYADYISPKELESVVQDHPGVSQCVVIGVPDGVAGHSACGVVVRRIGSTLSAKEIRTFVNSRVASSKQLKGGIVFLDELPEGRDASTVRHLLLLHVQKSIF